MLPLVRARGFLFCAVAFAAFCGDAKKRGWTIQHRPTSNPSKALPDSPGRAARKPAGKKASVLAGLKRFSFRTIHGGSGSKKQVPGLASLFGTRKTRFQRTRRQNKQVDCLRTRLQIDCHLFGLEGSQDHIKLFHVASSCAETQTKIPRKKNLFRGEIQD
jgi:hypothetical protein